jgi:hypothetical protein
MRTAPVKTSNLADYDTEWYSPRPGQEPFTDDNDDTNEET